jgi:ABC-type uncharacterized transport system permease subunit
MHDTSVFWLRAAAALYAVGLFHTLHIAIRRTSTLFRPALIAFAAGLVLHMVAIVEAAVEEQTLFPAGFHNSVSLSAFLIGAVFLFVYWRYKMESLGVLLFPLVFVMTTVAAIKTPMGSWASSTTRNTWLVVHIVLVLLGYAALLVTALASLLYLLQERQLKRKKSIALLDRLPPLGTLDTLITRSLGFGFVLLTIGVVTGATWAYIESGGTGLHDPRMTSAGVTWGFCLMLVLARISAGWRGRKAAVMAVAVVACSAATWAFHYVSH